MPFMNLVINHNQQSQSSLHQCISVGLQLVEHDVAEHDVRNIMWNNSSFNGNMAFHSNLSPLKFFWIVMSNLVVTVLTFGLMRPWAMVRQARYVASCSAISTDTTLDGFVGEVKAAGNAGAAEYMDFEGIDLGVGV